MLNLILEFLSGIGLFLFAIFIIDKNIISEITLPTTFLKKIEKPYFCFWGGLISTLILQSSSAINSIVAGLHNKNKINEKASFFIVAGSNIGTTVTAYFAIMKNNSIMALFSSLIFFSTLILMILKNEKKSKIVMFLCCFSMIFISFTLIGNVVPKIVVVFDLKILLSSNRFIPFLISFLTTAICQSSALISVIIATFAKIGILSLDNAIFMLMAANIGTCSTIFIVSIGKSINSYKVAIFNLLFNLTACIIFIIAYYSNMLYWFLCLKIPFEMKIPIFNTFYNIVGACSICPLINKIADKRFFIGRKKN